MRAAYSSKTDGSSASAKSSASSLYAALRTCGLPSASRFASGPAAALTSLSACSATLKVDLTCASGMSSRLLTGAFSAMVVKPPTSIGAKSRKNLKRSTNLLYSLL